MNAQNISLICILAAYCVWNLFFGLSLVAAAMQFEDKGNRIWASLGMVAVILTFNAIAIDQWRHIAF